MIQKQVEEVIVGPIPVSAMLHNLRGRIMTVIHEGIEVKMAFVLQPKERDVAQVTYWINGEIKEDAMMEIDPEFSKLIYENADPENKDPILCVNLLSYLLSCVMSGKQVTSPIKEEHVVEHLRIFFPEVKAIGDVSAGNRVPDNHTLINNNGSIN